MEFCAETGGTGFRWTNFMSRVISLAVSCFSMVLFSIRWPRIWIWHSIISYTEGMMLSIYTTCIFIWHYKDFDLPERIRRAVCYLALYTQYETLHLLSCWSNKSNKDINKLRLFWQFQFVVFRLCGLLSTAGFVLRYGWLAFEAFE